MRNRILSSLFAVVCLCTVGASAQQTLGSVNGTVVDSSGASIPAAKVTVTDPDIGVTRTVTSQPDGFFQIFNLPIGTYKVSVTHEGFDTTDLAGIAVQEAHASTVNVSLKVGQTSESVEVTANPLLNATDDTNGYTLDSAQIQLTRHRQLHPACCAFSGDQRGVARKPRYQLGAWQSAHLGEWSARYLEHASGQWRGRHQSL
jgi:hypothetical protein